MKDWQKRVKITITLSNELLIMIGGKMKGTKVIESILMLQKAEILELKKNRNDEPLFYYDDMKERK